MKNELDDVLKILVSEEELDGITTRIAAQIDEDYGASEYRVLLVAILKGSVVFLGDLMRKIKTPIEIDFMKVSSYGGGTKSTGNVNIHLDLQRADIADCEIILVEDIVDSGRTLSHLVEYLKLKGARSVRTCTLLDKPSRRDVDFKANYVGREIPDEFVIGYGLDFDEKYRALPFVGVLKPEAYEK
ncbi:MAG: hypoxanthine phosphoribosyltransferase [Clostridia bacterium]|nr:hypoxanthine phosphoribosyltransferase [Clostridia bacterium]